jgi:TonB family protein
MPVPFNVTPSEEPVFEPHRATSDETVAADPQPIVENPTPPPPGPIVFDESTADLVLPRPLPGRVHPDYPTMAVLARAEGQVVLRAVITAGGRIDSIEVVRSPPLDLGMTDAAIEAVSGWEYSPGSLGGRPVAVRLTVVVDFVLD